MSQSKRLPLAEVRVACGRCFLSVAGIAVAMETDPCREISIPEALLEPIPQHELDNAYIGGKAAKDLPIEVVRYFRGDSWTPKMLDYVADKINKAVENGL